MRVTARIETFNIVLDARNPSPDQLAQAVTEILRQAIDPDGGFKLSMLPEGLAYPDWNSIAPEL